MEFRAPLGSTVEIRDVRGKLVASDTVGSESETLSLTIPNHGLLMGQVRIGSASESFSFFER